MLGVLFMSAHTVYHRLDAVESSISTFLAGRGSVLKQEGSADMRRAAFRRRVTAPYKYHGLA